MEEEPLASTLPILFLILYGQINQISSLSFSEFVQIAASFHLVGQPKKQSLKDRGYTPEQLAAVKAAKPKNRSIKTLNLEFSSPLENYSIDIQYVSSLYYPYTKHGTYPFIGPLTDQPNKIIEIFQLFDALVHEQQEKQNKR